MALAPSGHLSSCSVIAISMVADSCRYWLANTYEQRHAAGQEPQNVDKEFLRLWFRQNSDPYNDEVCISSAVTQLARPPCSDAYFMRAAVLAGKH